jgi:uncharacterized membrane protein
MRAGLPNGFEKEVCRSILRLEMSKAKPDCDKWVRKWRSDYAKAAKDDAWFKVFLCIMFMIPLAVGSVVWSSIGFFYAFPFTGMAFVVVGMILRYIRHVLRIVVEPDA